MAPCGDEFWEVKVRRIQEEKFVPEQNHQIAQDLNDYEYKIDIEQVYAHPLAKPATPNFDRRELPSFDEQEEGYPSFHYQSWWRQLMYVGNRYICIYEHDRIETGGSMRAGGYSIGLHEIEKLNTVGSELKIQELLSNGVQPQLREFHKRFDKIIDRYLVNQNYVQTETTQRVNEQNISIGRVDGSWYAYLPVEQDFVHYSNGTRFNYPKEFVKLNTKLPQVITSHDQLCLPWAVIGKRFPEGLDAVSAPNGDLLIVLTDREILVFAFPLQTLDRPNLRIPIHHGEYFILNQWATGKYVNKWTEMLAKYFYNITGS